MKKFVSIFATLALVSLAGAQDIEKKMFGIGVTFPSISEYPALQVNLRPVPNIKTILELGFNSHTVETSIAGVSTEENSSHLILGLTGLKTISENNMEMQFGVRYNMSSDSEEDAAGDETSTNVHNISGVFGGEYFFSTYFSIDGSLSLGYNFGSEEEDGSPAEISIGGISSGSRLSLNFYFM